MSIDREHHTPVKQSEQEYSANDLRDHVMPGYKPSKLEGLRNSRGKQVGALLGIVGVLGAVGGGLTYAANNAEKSHTQEVPSDNDQSILPGQEISAEPTAGVLQPSPAVPTNVAIETLPVISPHEELVKTLEIKAGQEPDEIAKALVDRISKWCMAGSDEATAEKMLGLGYAPNDRKIYTDKLAAEQKEIYAEAIFGKNWQDNDDVREFVLKQEKVNAGVLLRYIITSNDAVPFTEAVALENYAFLSGDSMNGKFIIDSIVHENTDSIPKLIKLGFPNDNDGLFTLTVNYQTADEKITISSIG